LFKFIKALVLQFNSNRQVNPLKNVRDQSRPLRNILWQCEVIGWILSYSSTVPISVNKLVVRINDIPSFNTGNCIPLDILHYSSAHPVRFINRRLPTLTQIQLILRKMYKKLLLIMITIILKLKIIYIAGFVVRKLT